MKFMSDKIFIVEANLLLWLTQTHDKISIKA